MKVLITGSAGQDGYYLSKYFHRFGATVIGMQHQAVERASPLALPFLDNVIESDLADFDQVSEIIESIGPDVVVNFAAKADSWGQFFDPVRLFEINTTSVINMLEAVRKAAPLTRFFQASSSEIFSGGAIAPQSLKTQPTARTLYGVSKISADEAVRVYRQHFGLDCFRVVLFSHESPLRKENYFSRKIIDQALAVTEGKLEKIELFTPDSIRDWGYAGEYCRRIVDYITSGERGDILLGSGQPYTVREFAKEVCKQMGIDYQKSVIERSKLSGRAEENSVVYADINSQGFLGGNLSYTLPRLIRLLIRYARYARKYEE